MRRLLLALALLVASLSGTTAASAASTDQARAAESPRAAFAMPKPAGPPLRESRAVLDAALACSGDLRQGLTPVLLVHGTTATSAENWPAYRSLFARQGRPYCQVDLPRRGIGDLQVSVEYVVRATRRMAAARGDRIHVVGHSQGGLHPVYALRYWPDLAGLVDDYVGLAPALNGVLQANLVCLPGFCTGQAFSQFAIGSNFTNALTSRPTPDGPSYTTIAFATDEIVQPQPTAGLVGRGTHVDLVRHCGPLKVGEHFSIAIDGTAAALVSDAFDHPGPADVGRLPAGACQRVVPEGESPAMLLEFALGLPGIARGVLQQTTTPTREPALRCYFAPTCADVSSRGAVVARAKVRQRKLVLRTVRPGVVRVVVKRAGSRKVRTVRVGAGKHRVRLPLRTGRPRVVVQAKPEHYTRFVREHRLVVRR